MITKHNPIQTMLHEHEVICKAGNIVQYLDHYWESYSEKYTEIVMLLLSFFREIC